MNQIIILDTETNGREPAEVIELAYGYLREGEWTLEGHVEQKRFKPLQPSTFGALSTHHILPSELEMQPPSSEAKLPDGVKYIVAHNADYDWGALGKPDVKRICTLAIARFLFHDDSHSLGALLYRFMDYQDARIELKEAHSADGDVAILLVVLLELLNESGIVFPTAEDLWNYSEKCRVPTHFTFGKWKGTKIADVPYDYKSWCLRQLDFDPYVLRAIRESL